MSADTTLSSSGPQEPERAGLHQPELHEQDSRARGASRWIFPAVAILVSVVFLVESIRLGFGALQTPGAGLWPFTIAVLTIVLSVIQAVVPGAGAVDPGATTGVGAKPHARSLLLGGLVLVYALLVDSVGYLILTAVLVFVASVLVASARWWGAAITAVVTTGLVYMVFSTFLGIPLPTWPAF